jgi:hypothetical protein
MEDDLKDTWADIIPAKLPCTLCGGTKLLSDTRCPACVQAPIMPPSSVLIGKREWKMVFLHNHEHWINLLPYKNGRWEIQGFDRERATKPSNRLFWTREGVWMDERAAHRAGRDPSFAPDELEAQLELAIAGKLPGMS